MITETKNAIVIYEDKQGNVELRADIENDTIWATQEQIGQLFHVSSQNITMHLKNIFLSGELEKNSVCKESLHTGKDSKRYLTKFYNLDVVIAVGYRVNSKKATQFRIWATGILREYLKQGYVLNQYKLEKSPEALEGLDDAIALIESKKHPGKLKGKIVIKLTKNMEPSRK